MQIDKNFKAAEWAEHMLALAEESKNPNMACERPDREFSAVEWITSILSLVE